ncbi:MAG: hypothetical protein ACQERC_07805 [Bacteroidota bacterium]
MASKFNRTVHMITTIALLAIALLIVGYYLFADNYADLKNVPTTLYVAAILYILIQLIKRNITKKMPWYDWLYYLGLIAIVLPFILPEKEWVFSLAIYGSFALIVPPLIELLQLIAKKK